VSAMRRAVHDGQMPRRLHEKATRISSAQAWQRTRAKPLSDEHLATITNSPHLSALAHLRLVHQGELTDRSYEQLATARTLPRLSCLEVFVTAQWSDRLQERYVPIGRRERVFTRDTTRNVRRARHWIADVEQRVGHMPCFHPEIYYRPDYVDLESVIEHPIAVSVRGKTLGYLTREPDEGYRRT
jgi:hypothetical protein